MASSRRSSTGLVLGFCVGGLVVYADLSSLIATLGMNFMLRGLILILTEGKSIALLTCETAGPTRSSRARSAAFRCRSSGRSPSSSSARSSTTATVSALQVHVVGDNPDSAQQMGIDVKRVRVKTFIFVGLGAALAGVFSTMINFTWWPTSGDGYLLPVLASVFVGGTPTWGGIGTVIGGAIGALTVSFIQTGIVGVGSAASTSSSSTA